jgi:hypothetical protein
MILAQITTDLASASQEALGRQSALLVLSLNCYAKYLTNRIRKNSTSTVHTVVSSESPLSMIEDLVVQDDLFRHHR